MDGASSIVEAASDLVGGGRIAGPVYLAARTAQPPVSLSLEAGTAGEWSALEEDTDAGPDPLALRPQGATGHFGTSAVGPFGTAKEARCEQCGTAE